MSAERAVRRRGARLDVGGAQGWLVLCGPLTPTLPPSLAPPLPSLEHEQGFSLPSPLPTAAAGGTPLRRADGPRPSTTTKLAPREMAGMALTIEKASTWSTSQMNERVNGAVGTLLAYINLTDHSVSHGGFMKQSFPHKRRKL